jgi:hypothetical protein
MRNQIQVRVLRYMIIPGRWLYCRSSLPQRKRDRQHPARFRANTYYTHHYFGTPSFPHPVLLQKLDPLVAAALRSCSQVRLWDLELLSSIFSASLSKLVASSDFLWRLQFLNIFAHLPSTLFIPCPLCTLKT